MTTRREVAALRRLAVKAAEALPPTRRNRWRVVDNGIQVRLFLARRGGRGWVSRTLATLADLTWLPDYLVERRAELDSAAP